MLISVQFSRFVTLLKAKQLCESIVFAINDSVFGSILNNSFIHSIFIQCLFWILLKDLPHNARDKIVSKSPCFPSQGNSIFERETDINQITKNVVLVKWNIHYGNIWCDKRVKWELDWSRRSWKASQRKWWTCWDLKAVRYGSWESTRAQRFCLLPEGRYMLEK